MKFEIPFEENIYRKQINLTFKIAWEKYLIETKKTVVVTIVSVFLGFIIRYGKGDIGNLFLILAVVFGCIAFNRFNKYNVAKKETESNTIKNIEKWIENPISIWEFENSYFRFKFYGGDYKINWDNFKYFNVTDSTLFFGFEEKTGWYTLSESEIGKDNFDKVVVFVTSKIKPFTNSHLKQ